MVIIGSATAVVEWVNVKVLYYSTKWGCKICNNNSVSVRITISCMFIHFNSVYHPLALGRQIERERERNEINRRMISCGENNSVRVYLFFTSIARHFQFVLI